jgi:protein TonB
MAGSVPPRPIRIGAPEPTPPQSPRRLAAWLAASALLHAAGFVALTSTSPHESASLHPIPIAWVRTDAAEPDAGGMVAAAAPAERPAIPAPKPAAPAPKAAEPAPKPRPARERRATPPPTAAHASAPHAAPPAGATVLDAGADPSPPSVGAASGSGVGRGSAAGIEPGWMPRGGAQPAPKYPETARRRGAQGTAQVALRLAANGRVADVRLHRSSGDARLDDAALAGVRRWRYDEPPSADWTERWFVVPIEFHLQ